MTPSCGWGVIISAALVCIRRCLLLTYAQGGTATTAYGTEGAVRLPRAPSLTGSLTPLDPILLPIRQLQWMASSGHCTNIFSSSSTHMGTGATGRYWVQVRT